VPRNGLLVKWVPPKKLKSKDREEEKKNRVAKLSSFTSTSQSDSHPTKQAKCEEESNHSLEGPPNSPAKITSQKIHQIQRGRILLRKESPRHS